MFLLNPQNNFYIILSSYVEGHVIKKFMSELYVFDWFPGLQNLDVFWKIYCEALLRNHFQAEIKPQSLLFLDFVIVFHIILKNQKN